MEHRPTGSLSTTIVAESVRYYHLSDEAMFFAWLDRMALVTGYRGVGRCLFIELARAPTDDELLELLAFCRRYRIDMRQLAAFRTPANEGWFAEPRKYWHRAVFGPGRGR